MDLRIILFNIIMIYFLSLWIYYLIRLNSSYKSYKWWANKVKDYIYKKYNINNLSDEEFSAIGEKTTKELIFYLNKFPGIYSIAFNSKIKDLRSAFQDKELFDKVVYKKVNE